MANTQVNQKREAIIVSGTASYQITTTCVEPGALQDTGIFLLDIVNADDPKDDVFSRVIEIADITAYSNNRAQAITNGDSVWRSSTAILIYEEIETANASWKELSSRINVLVENYDAYLAEFATTAGGDTIVYPALDESAKTALKDEYYAADTALKEAQTALLAHSCEDIETEISTTETQLTQAQSDLALYSSIQATLLASAGVYNAVYGTLLINNGNLRNTSGTSSAVDSEKDAIETLLVSNDAYLNQFNVQNAALTTLINGSVASTVASLQSRVTSLTQDKNQLFTDLNKCRTDEAKLQAAVTSAQATRDAALASVVAVCPDFVP